MIQSKTFDHKESHLPSLNKESIEIPKDLKDLDGTSTPSQKISQFLHKPDSTMTIGKGSYSAEKTLENNIKRIDQPFKPALEGLRGFSIALILIGHCYSRSEHFSYNLVLVGITISFVLSGYLITGRLLKLQKKSGFSIDHLGIFFAARMIRLMPALVLCVVTTVCLWINQGRSLYSIKPQAITTLLFVENSYCKDRYHENQVLAHTWSIAVEQQFYILWVFLILLIRPLKPSLRSFAMILLIILSLIYRLYKSHPSNAHFVIKSVLGNAYALLAGCTLQLSSRSLPRWSSHRYFGYFGLILFVLVLLLLQDELNSFSDTLRIPILTVFASTATISAAAVEGNFVLEHSILRYLGKVSFSLYLWSYVFLWFSNLFHQITIPAMGIITLSLAIAHCSTFFLEEPIRECFRQYCCFKEQDQAFHGSSDELLPND